MRRSAKILIQCLVFLGLIAAASIGASAGNASITQLDEQVALHHIDNKPCTKFEFPDPHEHQCHRVTSQAPVSSRPRTSDKSEIADLTGANIGMALRDAVATEIAEPSSDLRQASRRSSFWQVFAYSARLRN